VIRRKLRDVWLMLWWIASDVLDLIRHPRSH